MPQITELPIVEQGESDSRAKTFRPLQVVTPPAGACGSGCSSCGESTGVPASPTMSRNDGSMFQMPFAARRLALDAVPAGGSWVRNIDLDLTVECNLRCTYCFKEKWNEHMEERVAFDTIVWFIHASGPAKEISVNFMGGEPLIRFKMIQKLVPFAKRRHMQHGKRIHFGMTTNGTLVTNEVIDFWKQWGLGFHTSIDGTPAVQDKNRPTTGGKGSSRLVAKAVPKILAYRPGTTAQSTVVPESAGTLVESYHYFRSLGYKNIAFVPGGQPLWSREQIELFQNQFFELADLLIAEARQGNWVELKGVDDYLDARVRDSRHKHACGAGRGMVLIDIHGDIWPCHRWNKKDHANWRIGSIYEQFNEAARRILDVEDQTVLLEQDCPKCMANKMCSGGCPAENLEHTGSVYRRHINSCELTRARREPESECSRRCMPSGMRVL